ncbi:E3 ubiquitin-protein ligase TRIM13 [Arapaima gigas]
MWAPSQGVEVEFRSKFLSPSVLEGGQLSGRLCGIEDPPVRSPRSANRKCGTVLAEPYSRPNSEPAATRLRARAEGEAGPRRRVRRERATLRVLAAPVRPPPSTRDRLYVRSPWSPPMELLEEELTCAICCYLFEDPRVLPCSHSFCRRCLEGILEGNSRSPLWKQPFKCPTCRKETHHNGASSLQVNYSLRGIVEKYNKIRVFPKMSLCRQHSGQPLNIFCATDLKLICGFCATMGDHNGHKFCALEDAYEQERAAFEDLFQGFETWRSADVLSCLEALETNKKKALQLISRDAEKVTEYFDKLAKTLNQKKNEIVSDFETWKLMVMQAYDPEINRLSAVLEEHKRALKIAQSFRDAADPLCFLQQMQEFREKLRVIQETSLPSQTCMDVGAVVKDFDVKVWDTVHLRDVEKIAVAHKNKTHSLSSWSLYKVTWLVAIFICFSLCAMFFLEGLDVSRLPAAAQTYVGNLTELLHYTAQCWREVARVCVPLFELLHTHVFDLLNTTADLIWSNFKLDYILKGLWVL